MSGAWAHKKRRWVGEEKEEKDSVTLDESSNTPQCAIQRHIYNTIRSPPPSPLFCLVKHHDTHSHTVSVSLWKKCHGAQTPNTNWMKTAFNFISRLSDGLLLDWKGALDRVAVTLLQWGCSSPSDRKAGSKGKNRLEVRSRETGVAGGIW